MLHSFVDWADWFFQRKNQCRSMKHRPRKRNVRLMLECLEDRTVPSGIWETLAPMAFGQTTPESGVIDDQLYVFSGEGPWPSPILQRYNPATDTWTTMAPMSTSRGSAVGEAIGTNLYAIGGGLQGDWNNPTGIVEIYDASTNTWGFGASMPTPRVYGASAVIDGKIYVAGGEANYNVFSTLTIYDPGTNTWTTGPAMPTARGGARGVAIDGKLYVIGGSTVYYAQNTVGVVEIYDPATNTWTTGPSMPTPRAHFTIGVIDGKIYATGGMYRPSGQPPLLTDVVEVYDPMTSLWSTETPVPETRMYGTAEAIQGKLYVAGGFNWLLPNPNLNTLLVFSPVSNETPVVNAGADASIYEGSAFVSSGFFTDANPDTWTATVDFGDASGEQALTLNADKTFNLNHLYPDNGVYTMTVTVDDGAGGIGTDTAQVIVETPAQGVQDMITAIQGLSQLNSGEQNALTAKLDAAIVSLDRAKPNAAKGQLGAFINQVKAFKKTGRLDAATADLLIDEAQELIGLIV